MQKELALGVVNQWTLANSDFDIFRIGIHRCPTCSVFHIGIAGFGIAVGLISVPHNK